MKIIEGDLGTRKGCDENAINQRYTRNPKVDMGLPPPKAG